MKSRSLFNIINGIATKPAKEKNKRIVFKPVPIGYIFALKAYYKGEYLDTLFADHIDICRSHTVIHFNNRLMEVYPQKLSHTIYETGRLWAFYENNTEIEITRIS
jgi:hypothetical protein